MWKNLLLSLVLFLTSCSYLITPPDHELWGGYESHNTYELKQDLFLVKHPGVGIWALTHHLLPPKKNDFDISTPKYFPLTIEEYLDPDLREKIYKKNFVNNVEILGVLPRGTAIKTTKAKPIHGHNIMHVTRPGEIIIYAKIMDGKFEGTQISINDISLRIEDGEFPTYSPIEDLLED